MVLIEVEEFVEIYGFGVVEVLINCLVVCKDEDDVVYCMVKEKYDVIVSMIKEFKDKG